MEQHQQFHIDEEQEQEQEQGHDEDEGFPSQYAVPTVLEDYVDLRPHKRNPESVKHCAQQASIARHQAPRALEIPT